MKSLGNKIGLILIVGLGFYLYVMWQQSVAIETLCESHGVGATLGNGADLAEQHGVQLMGPIDIDDKPGTQRLIFCAPLTLCDVSCTLDVSDNVVTLSEFFER